ncbi:unnamed protein product [Diplocarpon coronariae]
MEKKTSEKKYFVSQDTFGFKDDLERSQMSAVPVLLAWEGLNPSRGSSAASAHGRRRRMNLPWTPSKRETLPQFARDPFERETLPQFARDPFERETLPIYSVLEIHLSGKYTGEPREYLAGLGRGKDAVADTGSWPQLSSTEFWLAEQGPGGLGFRLPISGDDFSAQISADDMEESPALDEMDREDCWTSGGPEGNGPNHTRIGEWWTKVMGQGIG